MKWALVNPNGSIASQSGGITVTNHATGQTILDFGAASNAKLIEASAGFANDNAARGTVVAGHAAARPRASRAPPETTPAT